MIRIAFLLLTVVILLGCQSKPTSITVSSVESPAGTVVLSIGLRDSKKEKPVALQWRFDYSPAALSHMSVVEAPQLRSSAKHLTCSGSPDRTVCLVWGSDRTPIPEGRLALAQFALRQNSSSPKSLVSVRDAVASSGDGSSFALALPPEFSVIPAPQTTGLADAARMWAHGHYREITVALKRIRHAL